MKLWQNIQYAPDHGVRGCLDVSTPDQASETPIVMVIHGGALREFSKERMVGIVEWVVEQGWAAVNVNYRLLPDVSFPAPLDDTLSAFRWIKTADHEALARLDRGRVALLGASAGGFLALTAGLILGMPDVRAIVSIAGPTRPNWYPGVRDPAKDAHLYLAPVELVAPNAPPVLAVHSRNDKLVPTQESIQFVEIMRGAGRSASLYLFDGPGEQHGVWRNTTEPLHPSPDIEHEMAVFLCASFQMTQTPWHSEVG